MNGLYTLMDTLLPFEWLHYTFMKNALLAIILLRRFSACWAQWQSIIRWRSSRTRSVTVR